MKYQLVDPIYINTISIHIDLTNILLSKIKNSFLDDRMLDDSEISRKSEGDSYMFIDAFLSKTFFLYKLKCIINWDNVM